MKVQPNCSKAEIVYTLAGLFIDNLKLVPKTSHFLSSVLSEGY